MVERILTKMKEISLTTGVTRREDDPRMVFVKAYSLYLDNTAYIYPGMSESQKDTLAFLIASALDAYVERGVNAQLYNQIQEAILAEKLEAMRAKALAQWVTAWQVHEAWFQWKYVRKETYADVADWSHNAWMVELARHNMGIRGEDVERDGDLWVGLSYWSWFIRKHFR